MLHSSVLICNESSSIQTDMKKKNLFLVVICTVTPKPAKDLEQKTGRSSCSLAMHISICELESRMTVNSNSGTLDTAEVFLFSLKVERISRHALLKDYSIPIYEIYPLVL